jgi:hypothetical protein
VVQAIMRHAKMDMTLYYSHPGARQSVPRKSRFSNVCFQPKEGCECGSQRRYSSKMVDRELVYNDELTTPCGRLTQR